MPIFDTHAHYDADRFDSDRDATCPPPVRRQSWRNGTRMCTPPWASIRRTATAFRTAT